MADSKKQTDFSATDAALGYLYQVRLALLLSLQRLAKDDRFIAYLETLDDVVFETDGVAPDLLQMKHHRERAANLTDASTDLWKSFRVWIEGRASGDIPNDSQLYLITTSSVGVGSSTSYLLSENRDHAEALKRLRATASTSDSKTNAPAYSLFINLSLDEQSSFISSVIIIPNAPHITDVGAALRAEAYLAVQREHLDSFLSRLEGWWYGRAVEQLSDPYTQPILSNEIEDTVDEIRNQFRNEALPVDEDILQAEIDADTYNEMPFVQQIKLAGISDKRILTAIRDYYRAFEQRSRWVRDDLVLVGELGRYERLLREAWEIQFDRICDELGEEVAEDAKQKAARRIYTWVEESCYPIRKHVRHPSMTRGSFHMLSDSLRIGWHPEFMKRLQRILEPQEVV